MLLYKGSSQPIQDVDEKEGIVVGYFSAFGNIDSDEDVIQKGAFTKTIAELGPRSTSPRIKHFINHDRNQVPAVIKSLSEDQIGLRYESKAGSHTLGQDWLKMCQEGIITEHSIGYKIIKSNKGKMDGRNVTFLTELKLWEGSSMTHWGANEYTPIVGVKSLEDALSIFDKLEKALKSGTYSDETFLAIEARYKELSEVFKSYQTTQPEEEKPTTEPEEDNSDSEKAKELINIFKTALRNGRGE